MIYFDNSATTLPSQRVREAMAKELETPSNPSSMHRLGYEAHKRLEEARQNVADSIHASENEIVFTSGGTEADNLAVLGSVKHIKGKKERIITTDAEHPAVSEAVARLEKEGFEIIRLSTKKGVLSEEEMRNAVNENTVLCAVMHTNNETGAVFDIARLSRLAKAQNPDCIVFCDCVQGYMKSDINPRRLGADLLSLSSHKIHGPKGVGALYVRSGIRLSPVLLGGGQENALRSGTENLPGIVGFGEAAKEGTECLSESIENMKKVRERLIMLCSDIPGVTPNIPENPSCHILSLQVKGFRSEVLLHTLSDMDIFVSSGSACSSHKGKSPVLRNFGLSDEEADRTVRISLSRMNTVAEAEEFARAINTLLRGKAING